MEIRLEPGHDSLPDYCMLFSETNTRFIAEVQDERRFKKAMGTIPIRRLGRVNKDARFRIFGRDEIVVVDTAIDVLKSAWQAPFRNI